MTASRFSPGAVGLGLTLGAGLTTYGLWSWLQPAKQLHADGGHAAHSSEQDGYEVEDVPDGLALRPLAHLSFGALLRAYTVYTVCRFPILVDAAPHLLSWAEHTSLPFVASIARACFRRTFFDQFVGGETAEGAASVIQQLDRMGLGTIFVYSVEYLHDKKDEDKSRQQEQQRGSAIQEDIVQELLHSVDVGSDASSSSAHDIMVAIKLSGLLRDPHILERASAAIVPRELFSRGPPVPTPPTPHQGSNLPHGALSIPLTALPAEEQSALRELWQALRRVTMRAHERGNVRLLIDAEYSWYQPAIDAMYEALAAEFNSLADDTVRRRGPLVYNTFQAYLRRTPSFLSMSLERARAHGYALGVKLVRGAYVEIENKCWRDTVVDPPPTAAAQSDSERSNEAWGSPVWPSKRHSDECYDACARLLVDEVANDCEAERSALARGKSESEAMKFRRTAVVFASHNLQSGLRAIRRMVERGLASPPSSLSPVSDTGSVTQVTPAAAVRPPLVGLSLADDLAGRISFGQLYGMADTVSARLLAAFSSSSASSTGPSGQPSNLAAAPTPTSTPPTPSASSSPIVFKYLPYGPLELVMPYLIRRATENKSVVGGGAAAREVDAVWDEMMRRVLPWRG